MLVINLISHAQWWYHSKQNDSQASIKKYIHDELGLDCSGLCRLCSVDTHPCLLHQTEQPLHI